MAGIFRKLFKRLTGARKREAKQQAETAANLKQQRELAKQIGHIPGVRIPGVSPAEAAKLHREEVQRGRNKRVIAAIKNRKPTPSVREAWGPWHVLDSSNVDRVRYNHHTQKCQAVYKPHHGIPSRLYEYSGVERIVFEGWTKTHSPGQYQWYVIRAYGYPYKLLSEGLPTSSARDDIHAGEPFAITKEIEDFQRSRGRKAVDVVPTAQGVAPPPFWAQFRPPR